MVFQAIIWKGLIPPICLDYCWILCPNHIILGPHSDKWGYDRITVFSRWLILLLLTFLCFLQFEGKWPEDIQLPFQQPGLDPCLMLPCCMVLSRNLQNSSQIQSPLRSEPSHEFLVPYDVVARGILIMSAKFNFHLCNECHKSLFHLIVLFKVQLLMNEVTQHWKGRLVIVRSILHDEKNKKSEHCLRVHL